MNPTKSLNVKRLITNSITKFPSMVDEELHGYVSSLTQAPQISSLFWSFLSNCDQNRSQYVPRYNTYKKVLVGVLSNTMSFLLNHITQQKAESPASSCLLKVLPKLLAHIPNK
jgi:hypothetical protein